MRGDVTRLVQKYVALDSEMKPSEIRKRLQKAHGITAGMSTVSNVRTRYLRSIRNGDIVDVKEINKQIVAQEQNSIVKLIRTAKEVGVKSSIEILQCIEE